MTNPAQPKNRTIPLLLVAAVLGGLVYWDRLAGAPEGPPVAQPQRGPAVTPKARTSLAQAPGSGTTSANPLAPIRLEGLEATVKRPLFEPSRRAFVPPPPPRAAPPPPKVAAPPPPVPAFRLLGVVASGERSIAIITHPGRPTAMRLETGDLIDGWQIERIEPNRVVLARAGQKKRIEIFPRVE